MPWKIARLTPNDKCWEKPSGRLGKCQGGLFEAEPNNYGHEEWLNRNDGMLTYKGYRYTYVQGYKFCKPGDTHNVVFYTRRCGNPVIVSLVGYCKYLKRISEQEAAEAVKHFTATGAIATMIEELQAVGANAPLFQQRLRQNPLNIFNVKFKIDDLFIDCSLNSKNHFDFSLVGKGRFRLMNLQARPKVLLDQINKNFKTNT